MDQRTFIVLVNAALLFLVALTAERAARLIREQQQRLLLQNRQLAAVADQARQSERLKSRLLANVSHELRTPLNHLLGFTTLVASEQVGPLNERQKEYLRIAEQGGKSLLTLIEDLLETSRLEAGRQKLEMSTVELPTFLRELLPPLRTQGAARGVRMRLELDHCPPELTADRQRLQQIVFNLLTNAIKFSPRGGPVTLRAERTTLGEPPAAAVRVSVTDHGIGLEPSDLSRVFEPFTQVHGRAAHRGGTGLGLAIAKSLVELHGGTIGVDSAGRGKGTTFWFVLPLKQPGVALPANSAPARTASPASPTPGEETPPPRERRS